VGNTKEYDMTTNTELLDVTNQVFLQGTIGKRPIAQKTKGKGTFCAFSLATDEAFKDSDGETVKHTNWHQIKAWGKIATSVSKSYAKGDLVKLKGKLKTSTYEKDGMKMYNTSVELTHIKHISE